MRTLRGTCTQEKRRGWHQYKDVGMESKIRSHSQHQGHT
jgi:hypothetical protein